MNALEKWRGQVVEQLKAAGYVVEIYQGFPLVRHPGPLERGTQLLELKFTGVPVVKTIYREGCLFTPEPVRGVR